MSALAATRLRQRWLRITRPENGGPRPRTVLTGLARTPADQVIAEPLLDLMIAEGTFVMHGERRAAMYGRPRKARR